jgi:hypothetical protein
MFPDAMFPLTLNPFHHILHDPLLDEEFFPRGVGTQPHETACLTPTRLDFQHQTSPLNIIIFPKNKAVGNLAWQRRICVYTFPFGSESSRLSGQLPWSEV